MKTLNIILILTVACFADVMHVGSKVSRTSEIDALVEKFSLYFDEPMSYCDINPVSITAEQTGKKDGRIDITVDVYCDGTAAHVHYSSLIASAMGKFDRKTGEWDGLIGNLDSRNYFFRKMEKRYPWFSMRWDYSTGAIYIVPNMNYVGHSNLNPIWFTVSIDGNTLHDKVTANSADYGVDSLCLLDAGLSPGEHMMMPPSGVKIETKASYSRTVTYWVNTETLNMVKDKDVDVTLNRVYKFQTKGFVNRTYRFPSMNM